ncbi:MAG: AEC family transporter [Pseudomonadales bacterium]
MTTFVLVFASLLAGVFLQRMSVDTSRWISGLNGYIINFALPALILANVPGLQLQADALFPMLMPWLLAGLAFAIAFALGKFLRWRLEQVLVVALLMGLGNTAFFGLPIVDLYLGPEAVATAVIYDQLGSFLVLSLVATTSIALLSGAREALDMQQMIWRVLSFPPFISLLVALLVPGSMVPALLAALFDLVGTTILPLAMLIVGLQLKIRIAPEHIQPMLAVIGGKLLLTPLLVFYLGRVFAVEQGIQQATFLQSAMPPMVTPAILLIAAGIAPGFVASTLGISTLVSFVTVPFWVYFFL